MDELVSIIMPSYNTAKYIEESIKSVLVQTYTNWELIIVDDCSTDNTDEIVRSFLSDDRIKYFKHEKNSGAAVSRNKALREAKGKWIAFLDSDDLWLPEKLERQIAFMKANDYKFSYTDYEELDKNSTSLNILVSGPKKVTKKGMYRYCWVGCLTVMYDAEQIGLIQIKDIKKNNDYAMWLQVSKKANCYRLPECLSFYIKHEGSISSGSKVKLIKHHYIMWRIAEHKCGLYAIVLTIRNLFYGFLKKIKYKRRIKENKINETL